MRLVVGILRSGDNLLSWEFKMGKRASSKIPAETQWDVWPGDPTTRPFAEASASNEIGVVAQNLLVRPWQRLVLPSAPVGEAQPGI